MKFWSSAVIVLLAFITGLGLGYMAGRDPVVADEDTPVSHLAPMAATAMGGVVAPIGPDIEPAPARLPRTQAYVDRSSGEKLIRLGIQKTDCGCCQALKDALKADGLWAELDTPPPSNALQLTEYDDRCRVVSIDGVPFSGYGVQDLARIVNMKFRGDLPDNLASVKHPTGGNPKDAKPLHNERTLLVIQGRD